MGARYNLKQVVTANEVLARIAKARNEAIKQWFDPARFTVRFDLDGCLLDNGPRTLAILGHFIRHSTRLSWDDLQRAEMLDRLSDFVRRGQVAYAPEENWRLVTGESGLSFKDVWVGYWRLNFFTNVWLDYDRPFPGAVDFAAGLDAMGVRPTYLTGRHTPRATSEFPDGMEHGTRRSLSAYRFPHGSMFFKERFELSDVIYKARHFKEYGRADGVDFPIAIFDNEPAIIEEITRVMIGELQVPFFVPVLVETTSGTSARLPPQALVLRGFNS